MTPLCVAVHSGLCEAVALLAADGLRRREENQAVRVSLSGGGFRAALFHLGVIRYLREADRIKEVSSLHSVSGGSILAAHLVLNWHKYTANDGKLFEEAAAEVVNFCQRDIRGQLVRRWMLFWAIVVLFLVVPASLTVFLNESSLTGLLTASIMILVVVFFVNRIRKRFSLVRLLQSSYESLYQNAKLADLAAEDTPALQILATNLTTGDMASFGAHGLTLHTPGGDRRFEQDALPVSLTVAASSAFPPLFSPVEISRDTLKADTKAFPHSQYLSDGGVFDNLGLRAARQGNGSPNQEVVVSSAERLFDWQVGESFGFLPTRASRATDILMQRVGDLETDDRLWGKDVRIVSLREDVSDAAFLPPHMQRLVRNVRTDLDAFHPVEVQMLVYRGYCAARHAFQGTADCPKGIHMSDNGLPIATAPTAWLPAKESGLGQVAAEEILKSSPKSALRLWRLTDWTSWCLLVALLATLTLSYPSLAWLKRRYTSIPLRPTGDLAWSVLNASSGAARDVFQNHRNLRSYHFENSAVQLPETCQESANVLLLSEPFSEVVGERRVAPMDIRIESRLLSVDILLVKPFLLPAGEDYIRGPLPTNTMEADGVHVVSCPGAEPSSRLAILMVLCAKNSETRLSEEQDLGNLLDLSLSASDGG